MNDRIKKLKSIKIALDSGMNNLVDEFKPEAISQLANQIINEELNSEVDEHLLNQLEEDIGADVDSFFG